MNGGNGEQLVLPEDIEIRVSKDMYCSKVDAHFIPRDDANAVESGMHAKLNLVVQFTDDFCEKMTEHINGVPLKKSKLFKKSNIDEKKAEEDDEEEEVSSGEKDLKIDDCFDVRATLFPNLLFLFLYCI